MSAKVSFLDIETAPNIGYTWGMYEQNVIGFVRETYILNFSVKHPGEKVKTYSLPDYPLYRKDKHNDRDLVKKLKEVLDESDIVVAHNGDGFDLPKINTRIAFHGLGSPSPYKTIDTLKIVRKVFALNSNRLNDAGKFFNLGEKVATPGFKLWLDCMDGDKKAWALMNKYNAQDVILLEALYNHLRPWMSNHPNMNVLNGTTCMCKICGGGPLQKRGFNITAAGRFQKYQCQNCGGWSQDVKGEKLQITIK